MMRLLVMLAVLLAPVVCRAAPPDLANFGWREHTGARLPAGDVFRDEFGRPMRIGDLMQGHPLILALGYFHCPNLCGLVRSTLFTSLASAGLAAGRDYTLAAVSIDPNETSADSRTAKTADIAAFPTPGAARFRHYLTGDAQAIATLSDAVGYRGRFDAALKQFVHPTGLVVVTPQGSVSSYLLGFSYRPGDLRVALAQADRGTIRAAVVPVLLLCFHYDDTTGRYTLSVLKLLKLAAALTLVTVAGMGVVLFRKEGRA